MFHIELSKPDSARFMLAKIVKGGGRGIVKILSNIR